MSSFLCLVPIIKHHLRRISSSLRPISVISVKSDGSAVRYGDQPSVPDATPSLLLFRGSIRIQLEGTYGDHDVSIKNTLDLIPWLKPLPDLVIIGHSEPSRAYQMAKELGKRWTEKTGLLFEGMGLSAACHQYNVMLTDSALDVACLFLPNRQK